MAFRCIMVFGLFVFFELARGTGFRDEELLFYIERSRDDDIVAYALDINHEGLPNQEEPIKAFWIKHTEDGSTENLTRIQQQFGYGLNFEPFDVVKGWIPFEFVSMPDRKFYLTPDGSRQNYHVIFHDDDKAVVLEKLYIHFAGGSFLNPRIGYVQIFGRYLNDSQPFDEIVEP